jgi:phospholipid/cholesterol/gamma-HCH transport system substrate-binding protein
MRDERRNYVVVGGFVIAIAAAFVVSIAVLSGRTGTSDGYYVVYDNVMGLVAGTQVLYGGYEIGSIDRISPLVRDGRHQFRVDVRVRRGWQIPEDSLAQITASGLLSAVVVNIDGGRSESILAPGSEIPAVAAPNLFDAVASASTQLERLTDQITPVLESISKTAPKLVANLEEATEDLSQTLARVNELVGPTNTGRVDRILTNVENASSSFDGITADLRSTQARFDRIGTTIEEMIEGSEPEVSHAIVDVHNSLESVSQHIEAINRNVETMTRNLSEFSLQIRENPSVLIRGREIDGESGP